MSRAGPTSSLRAQRSNPESFRGGILDCFAALAMTELRFRPPARSPPARIPNLSFPPPPCW
ncbi:hypothetical protein CWO91_32600 [Bradyrhizobium genosp. SA-3]|nr:hypothetical protein CWO91_32600 [Bradyrhizobium genosp. SA-3]